MVKLMKVLKAKAAEQMEKMGGKKHKWKTKAAEVAYKKHAMHQKKHKWKTKAAEVAFKNGGYIKYGEEQATKLSAVKDQIKKLKATDAEALHALEGKDAQALRAMEGNETQWKDEDEHDKSEASGLVTEAKRLSAKNKKMVKLMKVLKAKAAEQMEKLGGKKHK